MSVEAIERQPDLVARAVGSLRGSEAPSSWDPIDLSALLTGELQSEPERICRRNDGAGMVYVGRINWLSSEPEGMKSWLAHSAAYETLEAGGAVLWLDFEDTARSAIDRQLALGVPSEAIASRFFYSQPTERLNERVRDGLLELAEQRAIRLVVVDAMTEALALQGLDDNQGRDVEQYFGLVLRPFARTGAAVLALDHVTKDREHRGRFSIGSQHKLAGVDGAALSLTVARPFGRGLEGIVRVRIEKDRPGYLRAETEDGRTFGEAHFYSEHDGSVAVVIKPHRAEPFRPTVLMTRLSTKLELAGQPLSLRAWVDLIPGKAEAKRQAARMLAEEGYASREIRGRTHLFSHLRRFDQAEGSDE